MTAPVLTVRPAAAAGRAALDWARTHEVVVDSAIALVLGVVGVARLLLPQLEGWLGFRDLDSLGVALVVVSAAPLAVRRRWPVAVLCVVGAATVALGALHYSSGGTSMLVGLYTVAATRRRGESLRWLALTLAAAVVALRLSPQDVPTGAWLENAAFFVTAYALGQTQRARRAYVAEVEARAERAEQQREAEAQVAVFQERRRIARELHDVVAHNVSVIVVQATAAHRSVTSAPDTAAEALRVIESTGRETLGEMRRLLGVLRIEDEPARELTPQPGTAQLPILLQQVREAGLDVELAVVGEPRPLPAGMDLTVYRIAQESLTNALKYAGPTAARVTLRYAGDAVEVLVDDEGRAVSSAAAVPAPGFGLVGMRERVALFDGDLEAGRRPDGGFRVRAHIPLPREESP